MPSTDHKKFKINYDETNNITIQEEEGNDWKNEKKPDEKKLQIQNLFKTLQNDPKSVFYSTENLSKTIIYKAKKSVYNKDKVFVNLYEKLEDKNFHNKETVPLITPFVEKKLTSINQNFTVLLSHLNFYMLILLI